MRIGVFTNCYLPLVNGVVGTVSLLRKGLIELGHDVFVFAPAFDTYQDEEQHIYRYPALDLTRDVKYPVAIPFSPQLSQILRHLDLDILHAHHPFVLGPVALRLARKRRIPIVSTFHTQYDQYAHYVPLPSGLVKWVARRQLQRFHQAMDHVTAPAESARQILLQLGVTRAIRVIPNPTNLAKFHSGDRQMIRTKYGLTDQPILMNIGRIAVEKNLGLLLEAFKRITEGSILGTVKLMIVGDGPELEHLKRQAMEMGLGEDVIFTGMVDTAQIPDYLAAADLFVMTSTSEVKPLAQIEALAAGVPIVAVAANGANDTITHGSNGLLVEQDPSTIAKAVVELLNSAQLPSFQKAAREAAEQYSYLNIAKEYLDLYQAVIKNKV